MTSSNSIQQTFYIITAALQIILFALIDKQHPWLRRSFIDFFTLSYIFEHTLSLSRGFVANTPRLDVRGGGAAIGGGRRVAERGDHNIHNVGAFALAEAADYLGCVFAMLETSFSFARLVTHEISLGFGCRLAVGGVGNDCGTAAGSGSHARWSEGQTS